MNNSSGTKSHGLFGKTYHDIISHYQYYIMYVDMYTAYMVYVNIYIYIYIHNCIHVSVYTYIVGSTIHSVIRHFSTQTSPSYTSISRQNRCISVSRRSESPCQIDTGHVFFLAFFDREVRGWSRPKL